MSTRMQLDFIWPQTDSVVFLVSATWALALNTDPACQWISHSEVEMVRSISHKLSPRDTTHAQHRQSEDQREGKTNDSEHDEPPTTALRPRGCHEETLAGFLSRVTTLNWPESERGRRGRRCCEWKESWMAFVPVKALVSVPVPIKTLTEEAGK